VKIFEPDVLEGYEWIVPANEDDFELLTTLNGTRHKGGWTPLPMQLVTTNDRGAPRKLSDFPWLGADVPVLSDRARAVVEPLVERDAEFLSVACEGRSLWLLNVCTIVDALDMERSKVELFESGRIMDIEKHVFFAERLQGVDAFKLANDRRGPIYLSGRVVGAIHAAQLVGHRFRLVWADEESVEPSDARHLG
jgi:hypothetical protein